MRYMPTGLVPARRTNTSPASRQQRRDGSTVSDTWPETAPSATPASGETAASSTGLGHSFLADLHRFQSRADGCELLHAMAASVRHNLAVALHLWRDDGQIITLRVHPRDRWVQCNADLSTWSAAELARLQFSHAERLMPLREACPVSSTPGCGPLGPLLWQLATLGSTQELLPEIAGAAMYRLAPAPHLQELPLTPVMEALLSSMRGPPATALALADAVGCDTSQVHRFLNALYLQSALMVTRAFPAGWGSANDPSPASNPKA